MHHAGDLETDLNSAKQGSGPSLVTVDGMLLRDSFANRYDLWSIAFQPNMGNS